MKLSNVLITIFIYLYSFLLEAIRFTVLPLLKGVDKKKGWNLADRQRLPFAIRDFRSKNVIWVHAASMGEAKLLCKFLETLQVRHPDDLYLLTAVTRTGVEFLETNKPGSACAIGFLPLDTISLMKKILIHFNVSRVWLLETELWPSMLLACKTMGIPVGVANARLEEKSFTRMRPLKALLKVFFEYFDVILAQSDIYAQRYEVMGAKKECIHITGNIKGFILIKRPGIDEWQRIRTELNLTDQHFVLTAGCVHQGEGGAIRQCFDALVESGFSCKLIVVPRYIDEIPALLDEIGGNVAHFSDTKTLRIWDICVIGKMGILENMYKIADAAFIGGTFTDVGGHNVWEPARFGIPVFFGPDYHTQKESCEKLLNAGVAFKVEDGVDLANQIVRVLKIDAREFMLSQVQFSDETNKSQSILEPLIP